MKNTRRWMKSVVNEAAKTEVKMPWARGARRVEWKERVAARAIRNVAISA